MYTWKKKARRGKKCCYTGGIPTENNRCSTVPAPGASPKRNSQLNCSFQDHYCSHVNVKMYKASGPLTNRQEAATHCRAVTVTRCKLITEENTCLISCRLPCREKCHRTDFRHTFTHTLYLHTPYVCMCICVFICKHTHIIFA